MVTNKTLEKPRPEHASDGALAALFVDIFEGKYTPGDSLPPERVLAEQHGVSRIIVRQAVHALHDVGLVEARQGGATRVLDPARADARVLGLLLRFGNRLERAWGSLRRDLVEYQALYAIVLLEAAARHGSDARRSALLARVEKTAVVPSTAEVRALDTDFWKLVTEMGKNRILKMEMALWERFGGDDAPLDARPEELRWLYHALAKQLVARVDPLPLFLAHTRAPVKP